MAAENPETDTPYMASCEFESAGHVSEGRYFRPVLHMAIFSGESGAAYMLAVFP